MPTEKLQLNASPRDPSAKPEKLRKDGKLPAVFYGRKEVSTPITLDILEFIRVWHQAGESSVITIKLPEREVSVLIHEVDKNPVTEEPIHVDFYTIEANRAVEVSVPLEFTGTAPAVKEKGGTLVKVLHEVTVEGLPNNLPNEITVDISSLTDMDSHILVGDLSAPEGITIKDEPEDVVASISGAAGEKEEEEAAAEFDASAVEVEEKGKKEEEEEAGE